MKNQKFTFEISLSVLNHLGRNLYRSFLTVLGEAISNSWDADASNVWIDIDRDGNTFVIKDDGEGMNGDDFQGKFLKIGYSKRKDGKVKTKKGRPFIGRKGIGKLALLSCAAKITVLSKKLGDDYVGGVIDNSGLSEAIQNDLSPDEYLLGKPKIDDIGNLLVDHEQGTILYFEDIKHGIRNKIEYIKKMVALYFRFSLLDDKFNIFINDEKITINHLNDLINNTQFVWVINDIDDPFVKEKLIDKPNIFSDDLIISEGAIRGFVASVEKPSQLKILGTEEQASLDLFVNGRLREKDILKHIPTTRIVESYLYGQIHFDDLDGEIDRFTSSREGIVADDPKFIELLSHLKDKIIPKILEDWDEWRRKIKQDGDPDNPSLTKKERKSKELFDIVSRDFTLPKEAPNRKIVDNWVDELEADALFNFSSYADCFISENLIRKYIKEVRYVLSEEAFEEIDKWKTNEIKNKNKGNISIEIRRENDDLAYLSMDSLANAVDKGDPATASLRRDAMEYKPMRDAVAHTALLTDLAKAKLTSVYVNVKARINTLLEKKLD